MIGTNKEKIKSFFPEDLANSPAIVDLGNIEEFCF